MPRVIRSEDAIYYSVAALAYLPGFAAIIHFLIFKRRMLVKWPAL